MEEFKFTFVARVLEEENTLSLVRSTHGISALDSIFSHEVALPIVVKFMNAFLNEAFAGSPQFKFCPENDGSEKVNLRFG